MGAGLASVGADSWLEYSPSRDVFFPFDFQDAPLQLVQSVRVLFTDGNTRGLSMHPTSGNEATSPGLPALVWMERAL